MSPGFAAVTAAVETDWSNGQVEGQINRLKAIKRQCMDAPGSSYCGLGSFLTTGQVAQQVLALPERAPKVRKSPFLLCVDTADSGI